MEKFKFNPKAKTNAYSLYEVMTKYGPKILLNEDGREINRAICEIYLNLYLDEDEKFITSLRRLNMYSSVGDKVLRENIVFFADHTSDSPLKSLNNAILEVLEGGRINQGTIDFILDKIKLKSLPSKHKSKTFVSIAEGVKESFRRELRNITSDDFEYIGRRVGIWVNEVMEKGIEEVLKDKSWGDHKLTRDAGLKGKRSVRLSNAGRIIYKIDQEIQGDTIVSKITIVKITSIHDYSE